MFPDLESLVGENLLTEQDIIDSYQAFFDLEETFFMYNATFVIRQEIEPINNDSRDALTSEREVLVDRVLVVPDNTDNDAENLILRKGTSDFTEAAMYVYTRTLHRLGLVDDNNEPTIIGTQDTVFYDGKEYDIFGINKVAPFVQGYVLIKFQIKRAFKKL